MRVVPNRVESWLLGDAASKVHLDECLSTGLIVERGNALMFRHELARQAIEGATPAGRRQSFHQTVLGRLLDREAGTIATARLVHHAAQAGDAAAVRQYAPEAAKAASALGAHREAAAHYQTALDHAEPSDLRNASEAAALGRSAQVQNAAQFAANTLPILDSIRSTGITDLRGLAAALNARGVRTARGGRWHVSEC